MRVLHVLAWVLFGVAALGVAAYWDAALYTLTISLAALGPYLMLAAVPAALFFGIGRRWVGLGLSVAVIGFLVAVTVPLFVATATPRDAVDVRVLTINCRLGQADPESVVDAVRRYRPDVLMLEELTPSLETALQRAGLDSLLPNQRAYPQDDGGGTGMWSRYAIFAGGRLRLSLESVVAQVLVPGFAPAPTFVALHVAGPYPTATQWVSDYKRLPQRLADLPTDAPVVVAGDFNATHSVGPFRRVLDGGYADAGDQAGAGLLRTYPSDNPLIGIDHVLTRGGVGRSAETVRIAGTDHRGLFVTVALARRS